MRIKLSIILVAIAVFTMPAACSKADTKTEKGRYSYAIGYNIGSNMKQENVEIDVPTFIKAVEDALEGRESRMTHEETQQAMQNLMIAIQQKQVQAAQQQKEVGEQFLQEYSQQEGVEKTASGLQYRVITEGDGPNPSAKQTVKVHYTGKLIDGTEFDSSYERGEPVSFRLDQVIPGWSEGVQLMNEGSKYEFVIPSDLGYGPRGHQNIPGNAVLIFEVELLDIAGK